ncbi:MAG: TlpA family protein disulfide reductase [Calditrichaeota bacterium]|nr:MAG: TlpA family protein disulfide reductase [Calditrichota bacterium]MBL1206535.1 TlpA family protein disulfide reductase [Calditrichota bacterium]NOG46362.1 TlpA family protein disulfide reductase [Calditrichota bacterium]
MKLDFKVKAIGFVVIVFLGLFWVNSQTTSADIAPKQQTQQPQNQAQQASQQEAPMAPAFTLQDVDGKKVSLADYKGKVVFLNFWATWCGPCRAEIPHFVELVDKYESEGFAILGISVDSPNDHKKIPDFMDKYKINYPVLLDDNKTRWDYGGIQSIPTTFVIDREGKALGKIVGARSKEQFEGIIKQVL